MALTNDTEKKFHELIKKTLGNIADNSPLKPARDYRPSARWKSLSGTDKENFNKLYTVKPKAIIGNGEVALFWLWNYHIDNLDDKDIPNNDDTPVEQLNLQTVVMVEERFKIPVGGGISGDKSVFPSAKVTRALFFGLEIGALA